MQRSPSHHLVHHLTISFLPSHRLVPTRHALQCPTGSSDFAELESSYCPLQESLWTCLGLSCRNRFPQTERVERVNCRLQPLSRKLTVATLDDKHGWPDFNFSTVLWQHESFLGCFSFCNLLLLFSCSVMSDFLHHVDCGLPGPSVHGILQARTLEWVAMPSSRGSAWPRDRTCVSYIGRQFFATEPSGKSMLCQYESFLVVSFVIYCYLL